jgi:nucleoside-diphosphate-sugar epimerase
MARGRSGQKYIFASGYMDLDTLLSIYEELTAVPKPRLRLPPTVMMGIAQVVSPIMARLRPRNLQRFTPHAVRLLTMGRRADTGKAQSELGFRPTPIRDALAEAYDDFARRGVVPANAKRPVFVAPTPPTEPRRERSSAQRQNGASA